MQGIHKEDVDSTGGFGSSAEYVYPLLHTDWPSSFFSCLSQSQKPFESSSSIAKMSTPSSTAGAETEAVRYSNGEGYKKLRDDLKCQFSSTMTTTDRALVQEHMPAPAEEQSKTSHLILDLILETTWLFGY